jgi:hypothetical protein
MEFPDYWVLDIYNRRNPDKRLKRYFYEKLSEARANFERRKGRGDLARVILMNCQGLVFDEWERK